MENSDIEGESPTCFHLEESPPRSFVSRTDGATCTATILPVLFLPPDCSPLPAPPHRICSEVQLRPPLLEESFPDYSVSSLLSAVPSANVASTSSCLARGCLGHPALKFLEGPHNILRSPLYPAPTPTRTRYRTRPTVLNRDLPRSKLNGSDTKRLSRSLSLRLQSPKTHLPNPGISH